MMVEWWRRLTSCIRRCRLQIPANRAPNIWIIKRRVRYRASKLQSNSNLLSTAPKRNNRSFQRKARLLRVLRLDKVFSTSSCWWCSSKARKCSDTPLSPTVLKCQPSPPKSNIWIKTNPNPMLCSSSIPSPSVPVPTAKYNNPRSKSTTHANPQSQVS